ncbi:MAG: FtsX-like permease family protein [Anaerolineae bacterium]|nr:FtsX-like permease family protein [Anaerolineae bacterium]
MFFELARLALSNLTRNRSRLIMTVSGVIVGTTAVMVLLSLTYGLQRAAESGVGASSALTEIRLYAPPAFDTRIEDAPVLDDETLDELRQTPGVQTIIPTVNFYGAGELVAGDYRSYAPILGIDPALLSTLDLEVDQGEMRLGPGEVIFGGQVNQYFVDPESTDYEPVTVDIFAEQIELRVTSYSDNRQRDIRLRPSALLKSGTGLYDSFMFMPLDDVLDLNEWVTGETVSRRDLRYDQAIVRTTDREVTQDVAQVFRDLGYFVEDAGDFIRQLNNFFTTMRLVLGGIGGIALIVAAFGIANTMSMAILERTKEIGVMKAVGARDGDVLMVFLVEAGLVGLVGGGIGVLITYGIANLVNNAIQQAGGTGEGGGIFFLPFDPSRIGDQLLVIPSELPIFIIAVATIVGLGAGLWPAVRAARLLPVVALRSE